MKKFTALLKILVVLSIAFALFASPHEVQATPPDPLPGTWYATWKSLNFDGYTGVFRFEIFTYGSDYYATMYVPEFGLFDQLMLVTISGGTIKFEIPEYFALDGFITDGQIHGTQTLPAPYPPYYDEISWQAVKGVPPNTTIDSGPGPECDDLPPLYCTGSAEYCSQLVPFDPTSTAAYIDYPINGETWSNQYRSYLRRDLMQLVSYATAKLQCKAAEWDFGSSAPLGFGDMSEADGSIPSTDGVPDHPPGTHTDGFDIDVAYYQFYAPDNQLRAVCDNYDGYFPAYHCTSQPYALDPWRTALFTAFIAEHPHLRVMGVDGKIGPILEDSLDQLSLNGWIDPALRSTIPLAYEETDQGWGWYLYHYHHMHISMNPVQPILLSLKIEPKSLNLQSSGKFISAFIELVDGYDPGQINVQAIWLTVDGSSRLFAIPDKTEIGDHNQNGIPDLMVKFDRQAVQAMLSAGWAQVTLYGAINGIYFQGADVIQVK